MNNDKTILLIDDETDLQELVKITLKTQQYKVVIAGNGAEGLQKLNTMKPDLIILDMNMPKMGGLEFYEHICHSNGRPRYPVLVLTARANMERLFKQFNIDGFMAKPFEIDDLLREVDIIIKKRSNAGLPLSSSGTRVTKKVCIVDNDPHLLSQIGSAFLGAGYMVNPAQNGTEGMERIANTVPDVALIKLGLADIPGDMVVLKLKYMAKTQDIKCILYTEKSPERSTIAQKIGQKEGVDMFVEVMEPSDLLAAANELLMQKTSV